MSTIGTSLYEKEQKRMKIVEVFRGYISQGLVAVLHRPDMSIFRRGGVTQREIDAIKAREYLRTTDIEEVKEFFLNDGQIYWLLPSGVVVAYVKGWQSIHEIECICCRQSISPGRYELHGMYYFFEYKTVIACDEQYRANRLNVYYLTNENYLPLSELNEGKWKKWVDMKDLPTLPTELEPPKQMNHENLL
ncbi:MAG: hypothetical protein HQK96_21200 [Nitrospirae bacterium]|nr:hypothetical protein [Nitrospirota bacterium]